MTIRTSYSQNNTYISCPQHWAWLYKEKYKSEKEGASLYFGTAVDAAVMEMLKGNKNYETVFTDKWYSVLQDSKLVPIFDNGNIVYGHNDFDEYVLDVGDKQQLSTWANELNLASNDPVVLYKQISKDKKNMYKGISDVELKYFNRASWLSLKKKGLVLIDAFNKQFLPRVKKVVDVQKFAKIQDHGTGDSINGFIDMVLEIDGYDKPIIFDLKTAAQPYTKDQIDLTEQLTLYAAMKSEEYGTNLVGYVVLCKNIPKEIINTCSSCGHVQDGRHKTCNNIVNNTRCGGTWIEAKILKPEVQVLVEQKTPEQINSLLVDYANIIDAMKANIVYKNISKCNNWYGGQCVFYNKCHGDGSDKGLIKKGDK